MKHPGGRPVTHFEPYAWAMRFGVPEWNPRKITTRLCWQLCQCRSDEARRLILGVSK